MKKPEDSQLICSKSDLEYMAQWRFEGDAVVSQAIYLDTRRRTEKSFLGVRQVYPMPFQSHHLRGLSSPFFPGLAWEYQRLLHRQEGWCMMHLKQAVPARRFKWHQSRGRAPSRSNKPTVPLQEWWQKTWTNWLALEASWEKMICCRIPVSPVSSRSLVKPDL